MFRILIDRYFIKQPRLRSAITRALYGRADREVEIFGSNFVINSLRENGYLRAARKLRSSSLLQDEISVLLSLSVILQAEDTFVDVGANIGIFCGILHRINQLSPTQVVRLYAYEPHPDTFRRLVLNTNGTGIIARNVAASDHAGELAFVEGAVSHVFTTVERSSSYNLMSRQLRVPCVRLDEEMIEGNAIVLKIDVEQQELSVIEGARKWFEAGRVKAVYLDNYADEKEVDSFLKSFGFTLFNGRSPESPFRSGFGVLALRMDKWPSTLDGGDISGS